MRFRLVIIFLYFISLIPLKAQTFKILESNSEKLKIEFSFSDYFAKREKIINGKNFIYIEKNGISLRNAGEPWLPTQIYNFGLPFDKSASFKILNVLKEKTSNISVLPYPDSVNQPVNRLKFDPRIYEKNIYFPNSLINIGREFIMRYVKAATIEVAPYQYNPVTRELIFNKKILVEISFKSNLNKQVAFQNTTDKLTEDFIKSALINPNESKDFTGKTVFNRTSNIALKDTFWYNPNKDYYKIYLKDKGLFRVTYDALISSGVPPDKGIQNGKLELINNGEKIPIEVIDVNNNGLFDSGDYFNFIGSPPRPTTPYTYLNIYNSSNVYWFSYQADSVYSFKNIDGFPTNFDQTIHTTMQTIHYEKDSLYERLGYAPDDHRDFWLWGNAEARSGQEFDIFTFFIIDSIAYKIDPAFPQATIRANLQGITNIPCPINEFSHSAKIKLNTNVIGGQKWSGQNSVTATCDFNFSVNGSIGIPLYSSQPNKFEISMDGDMCAPDGNDIARVNWFELDYWRYNDVKGNHYIFTSPPGRIGKNTYGFFNWYSDSMKIYIPSRGVFINNPRIPNDADRSAQFADSIGVRTDYYCYANDSYLTVDSIKKSSGSNLRNLSQGADYIIITHPDFISVANRLAAFRSVNLPGVDNPRAKIVNVNDIYDEFSYGLLDPMALQYFVKYAFENWQTPATTYITLLGDMSFDYRHLWASDRPDFIPSIPYQAYTFGQAPSDNLIVCIEGDDEIPDLAIGRLSCETVDEGNILVDKIINYPSDNTKNWKQNVLLMGGGIDADDEAIFGFNDQCEYLDNTYLKPNGIAASKVYRFPDRPEYNSYQGGGPEIRNQFDKGAVIANYYGHGGGGQWDLTFTNDDIYALNNGGRLPFISSVTCYTAHFDNQDIFGEKFSKVPGKGCIAFFGSSGLTWWQAGQYVNDSLFDEIFNKKNYIIGSAILNAKIRSFSPYISSQISLLTLLGDPAIELAIPKTADFQASSDDFTVSPSNPVKGDTVSVKILLHNLGITFNDSVTVALYYTQIDSSHKIGVNKLNSFGDLDSTIFRWIPLKAGLYNLIVDINSDYHIPEPDHSDNQASTNIAVFDFSKPNILKPVNGYSTSSNLIDFFIIDLGSFVGKQFNYKIEIDTSISLNSSARINSPVLTPIDGILKWNVSLPSGEYFWKAIIFDHTDTNTSLLYTFSINNNFSKGYLAQKKELNLLTVNNMSFNGVNNTLTINTALLPPRPSNLQFLDSINIVLPVDTTALTAFTTDGSFYYFANLSYYRDGRPARLYKAGTGLNTTIRGKVEGPIGNNSYNIKSQLFYYNNYLYAATGDKNSLLRIDKVTGDTLRVALGDSLIPAYDGLLQDGSYYVTSDGNYVYNLSPGYGNFRNQYTLRTFDPNNSWRKVGQDIVFPGTSAPGFSGFMVVDGYLYTFESITSGFIRRYKITDAVFEEEWLLYTPFVNYSLCYDWVNNNVIASTYKPYGTLYKPSFYKFIGTYKDAKGSAVTPDIGPALTWNNINYVVDTVASKGKYNVALLGLNRTSGIYDTLKTNVPPSASVVDINAKIYDYIKLAFSFSDSSYGASEPLKLKSVFTGYTTAPEISINKNDISFTPDSVLQGFNIVSNLKAYNYGESDADSVTLKYYVNNSDSAFMVNKVSIPKDSSVILTNTINTTSWHPATLYNTKIIASMPAGEFFTFNNIAEKSFYVIRDSVNPDISVTFDGKDINNGDIVSAKPAIVITIKDNGPLPLDTNMVSLVFDKVKVNYNRTDIKYTYTPYPNSQISINWSPVFSDGKHTLLIYGQDASGNFVDSVAHTYDFNVFSTPDLLNVFNYPNPFKNDTYFTFELHGIQPPEEFRIKVFTVAGRLIKDLSIPPSNLKIGFNKIYWDGRDQDGDEIANGVYFYKIASKNNGIIKTAIEKLAKIK
jgi:hypothetical protein